MYLALAFFFSERPTSERWSNQIAPSPAAAARGLRRRSP
jgi:hypothetical protein